MWRESKRNDGKLPRVDPWDADGLFRRGLRETHLLHAAGIRELWHHQFSGRQQPRAQPDPIVLAGSHQVQMFADPLPQVCFTASNRCSSYYPRKFWLRDRFREWPGQFRAFISRMRLDIPGAGGCSIPCGISSTWMR